MIDWHSLGELLAEDLQLPLAVSLATPVFGGDINKAFDLELGQHRFFVKLNNAELLPMFEAEKFGLQTIRSTQTLRVPEVYLTGCQNEHAFIVMDYIRFGGQPDPDKLAVELAAMHNCCKQQFGFEIDNTIGSTAQVNTFNHDWIEFWRDQRLGFQLELAERNQLDFRLIDSGYLLAEKLDDFFTRYQPRASLLHGDLWSGNRAADEHGNPVIFDPACYYGDHEADLAMMELFGHPGERFFAIYAEHCPLDDGYAQRRDLYNLYHVLNHANLFGGGYAGQARQMANRLLAACEG